VKTAHQTQEPKCKGEGQGKWGIEGERKGKRVRWEPNRKMEESHEDESKSIIGTGGRSAMHMASRIPLTPAIVVSFATIISG
jgi:hypothetical protein